MSAQNLDRLPLFLLFLLQTHSHFFKQRYHSIRISQAHSTSSAGSDLHDNHHTQTVHLKKRRPPHLKQSEATSSSSTNFKTFQAAYSSSAPHLLVQITSAQAPKPHSSTTSSIQLLSTESAGSDLISSRHSTQALIEDAPVASSTPTSRTKNNSSNL